VGSARLSIFYLQKVLYSGCTKMTRIEDLVRQDFGIQMTGNRWGRGIRHDSLVVDTKTQRWFWNSRGIGGGVAEYLRLVRGHSGKDILQPGYQFKPITTEEKLNENPSEKTVKLFYERGKENRIYWKKRLLEDSTIDNFLLGYFDGFYSIPIYESGVLKNIQLRRDEPLKRITYWYKTGETYLFNSDILPYTDWVVMTEGTVEPIFLSQIGIPAVAICGANVWNPKWFTKFLGIREVFYIEDNDRAGRLASKKVAQNLGVDRVRIIRFEGKPSKYDLLDFARDGNGKDEIMNLISLAVPIYNLGDWR
jgi:hypothetical protein